MTIDEGIDLLIQTGLARENDKPLKLHNLLDCRRFAKEVWTDKILLRADLTFSAARLHEILHVNEQLYYDNCPGERTVQVWFIEFGKEIA